MERIRIGVVGAGIVGQIIHLPNLGRLTGRFEICVACDPPAIVRRFIEARFGIPAYSGFDDLLATPLDAVLIASPDALHLEHVLWAFAAGLYVFCEKPFAHGLADVAEMIRARNAADKVLQVVYMKRFDSAYTQFLEHLPNNGSDLKQTTVEALDPDADPFVRHHEWRQGGDLPADLRADLDRKQREQVARAVPSLLEDEAYRGSCDAYASSVVHDVNAVHGLLDRLGVEVGSVLGAQLYAEGRGGQGAVRLSDSGAIWIISHLTVPQRPHYCERISLVFDDVSFELCFPSPWLAHHPTGLTVRRGTESEMHTEAIRCGCAEGFVEELKGFHAALTGDCPIVNTAEHSARDTALLADMAVWRAASSDNTARMGATG